MPIQTTLIPYELLARWDDEGRYSGAQIVFQEVKSVDGEVISRTVGEAKNPQQAAEKGFPFPDVLTRLQSDALVRVSELEAQVAEMEREKVTLTEAHAAEIQAKDANLQALLAEVDALKSEGAAMQAALSESEQAANAGFFTKLANLFTK